MVLVTSNSYSSEYTGKINRILSGPVYANLIIIDVVGTPVNVNGCQTNANYDFAFDGSTAEGKMYFSMILTAYSANLDINFQGSTTTLCTLFSGIENLHHVQLQ